MKLAQLFSTRSVSPYHGAFQSPSMNRLSGEAGAESGLGSRSRSPGRKKSTRTYLAEGEYEQSKYRRRKAERAEGQRVETIKEENEGESELSTILAPRAAPAAF